MAKRRPSGDGMVRKREDGRWEGRIVVGHKENGESIFHYISAKTQKALLEKLHRSMEEYDGAELTEQSRMTLGEWMDIWLEECAALSVRPSTLKGYRGYVEKNIKPYLGDKQICKVTTADVQRLYRKLQKEGGASGGPLAGTSVRRIHNVLHQALDVAVNRHLMVKNPSNDVTLPKKESTVKTILNDAQLERFMDAIKVDEHWHDFFYLEITTGLRRGELCGLKRNQDVGDLVVDPDEAEIVKLIFQKYLYEGYGAQRLCRYLSEQGIKNRKGHNIPTTTINRIIKNPIYTGVIRNGESQSEVLTDLQIIDVETFEKAQQMMEKRATHHNDVPLNTKGRSLLVGNVYCGHCGGRLTLTTSGRKRVRKDGTILRETRARYRVSTIGQVEKDDIPMQKQFCREFVQQQTGWEIVKEFSEKGVSGFKVSAKDRDAIQEIQRDALQNKFDVLLVFMFDRLGRREDETPFVVEWFVKNGIEVWSAKEGQQRFDTHVDKLLNYIRYWQASGESIKTSVRTKTRMEQLTQEGYFTGGGVPFGYRLEHQGRTNKRNQDVGDLVVEPDEAEIGWAEMYDNCTFEAKKMIVAQFVKAVRVRRDYEIDIEFNVSFEEFQALYLEGEPEESKGPGGDTLLAIETKARQAV